MIKNPLHLTRGMNAALISYLESLPDEHLQMHVAAYPWFTAARVVLTKKKPSIDVLRSAAVYVQDRVWLKNYYEVSEQTTSVNNNPEVEVLIESNLSENTNVAPQKEAIEEQPTIAIVTEMAEAVNTVSPAQNIDIQYVEEKLEIIESLQEKEAEEREDEPEADLTQPKSFNDWLQAFSVNKEGKVTTSKPVNDQVDDLETLIQSNIPYQMLETKLEAETQYAKGLDNFIQKQKQLKKAANANPVFDETTKHPVTETFAKLLVGQNKIKQAITIYQRLSLKFPSKSAYFAAHIKELESKI